MSETASQGVPITRRGLRLSYDAERDLLALCEFGSIADHRSKARRVDLGEGLRFLLRRARGPVMGFSILGLHAFNPDAYTPDLFGGPAFTVPALGLRQASVGEVCLAALPAVGGDSTIDVLALRSGWEAQAAGSNAAGRWFRAAIEAGELRGHLGLAASRCSAGDYHRAYGHSRIYSELARRDPWGWMWLGRACSELGDHAEGRRALLRAIRLGDELGVQTPAGGLLRSLPPSDDLPAV